MRTHIAALVSLFAVCAAADDNVKDREAPAPRILVKWYQPDDTGRLASVRPDGTDLQWHSEKITDGFMSLARWSPDGKRIAYNIQAIPDGINDPPRKVYIRGADAKTPITDFNLQGDLGGWSPDGSQLVVVNYTRDGATNELLDTKTGQRKELKLPAGHVVLDWSRDGKWFLTMFIQNDKAQLYQINRDGAKPRLLTAPNELAYAGRISPDGQKVLLISAAKPGDRLRHVRVVDVAGGQSRVVSPELNAETVSACWSPDSNRIAYTWHQSQAKPDDPIEAFLCIIGVDGKNQVTVASEKSPHAVVLLHVQDWRP